MKGIYFKERNTLKGGASESYGDQKSTDNGGAR